MVHIITNGEGAPHWLFLHGFLETSTMWSYLPLETLPGKKILLDLPGHGLSPLPSSLDNPSIAVFAEEIETHLKEINTQPLTVVGHSMGGYVGLELLSRKNLQIQRLVMINSNFWGDTKEKKKDRIRVADIAYKAKAIFINEAIPKLFYNPKLHHKEIEALKKEALLISADGIAYSSLAMRTRTDFSQLVKENLEDFVFIHGSQDNLIPIKNIIEVGEKSRIHILENTGHMAYIEASDDVLNILSEIGNPPKN